MHAVYQQVTEWDRATSWTMVNTDRIQRLGHCFAVDGELIKLLFTRLYS